jgi:tetratricopeptide (TPR) repeat protein
VDVVSRDLSMKAKVIIILWLLLMVFFISASGQQTAEDLLDKGADLAQQGKYDDAILAYNRAIEINPQDATTWDNKGWTLNNQGGTMKLYSAWISP